MNPSGRHQKHIRPYHCFLGLTACLFSFQLLSMGTLPLHPDDLVFQEPTDDAATYSLHNKSSDSIDHFVQPKRELPGNKVFLAGPWVPTQIIQRNSMMDPNLEYHVFNYSAMAWSVKLIDRELREKAGLEGAWEAWASLRPWAYRVDLWRYMVLWSEGGMYMDSKMHLLEPISMWAALSSDEEFSCCHDNDMTFRSSKFPDDEPVRALWNAMMSARKGSRVMLEAIRATIGNVLNHTYGLPYFDGANLNGHDDLSITGPILLGYAAKDFVPSGSVRIPCGFQGGHGFLEQSTIRIFEQDGDEHSRVRESGNRYGELYGQGLVYCDTKVDDGPDTPCDLDALLNATASAELVFMEPTDAATSLHNKSSDWIDHFVLPPKEPERVLRELPGNKVFMAGPWVPTQVLVDNSVQDPSVEFHVFNYSAMAWSVKLIDRELREKAGLEGAWEAWASLRPWAYRVDLWRYMILWSEGGVYLDAKMLITAPLSMWAALSDHEELSCCLDHGFEYRSHKFPDAEPVRSLANGMLSARKGSHVMLEVIRATIGNVLNHAYILPYFDESDLPGTGGDMTQAVVSITGPVLLGYVVKDFVPSGSVRIPCIFQGGQYVYLIEPSNYKVLDKDNEEYSRVQESPNGNKYRDLYKQGLVYCDSKPPTGPDIACDLDALLNATQIQGI